MQLGELQRVKSLHPNGGSLSKELMRPSMRLERPSSFINSGVPLPLPHPHLAREIVGQS